MNQLFILHVEIVPFEKKFGFAHLIRGESSQGTMEGDWSCG